MENEIEQVEHLKHTLDGRELREWVTEHNLSIRLSEKQSKLLYLTLIQNQPQYRLTADNHSLYLLYVDEEGKHAKEMTIDDVIDLVCELEYEKINTLQEKALKIPYQDADGYSNFLNLLTSYYRHYQELLGAYVQTSHFKNKAGTLEDGQEQPDRENEGIVASVNHKKGKSL